MHNKSPLTIGWRREMSIMHFTIDDDVVQMEGDVNDPTTRDLQCK
jgi:hypothetical protein